MLKRLKGRSNAEKDWLDDVGAARKQEMEIALYHGFPLKASLKEYSVYAIAVNFEQEGKDWKKVIYDSARFKRRVCNSLADFTFKIQS